MTAILTTAGAAHILELNAGGGLSNAFDAMVFATGNAGTLVGDTLAALPLADRLGFTLRKQDGYPKLDDTDGRNPGRGPTTWTWRFERQAGEPFVASNVAVTNYSNGALIEGAPLLTHGKQVIAQRFDERLVVWVNVSATALAGAEVTVYTAREDSHEGRIQRVVGFVARNRALSGSPNGSVIHSTEVVTRPTVGQHVWTAADIIGLNGAQLNPGDVVDFTLSVDRQAASTGQWTRIPTSYDLDCSQLVSGAYHYGDQRWSASGGYNVAHVWTQPVGTREGTYRLTYRMELCDEDIREWTNIVEVG